MITSYDITTFQYSKVPAMQIWFWYFASAQWYWLANTISAFVEITRNLDRILYVAMSNLYQSVLP